MPTILQLRRGSTAENDAYTGSVGELTVDTTLSTVRLHDGSTAGGSLVGNLQKNIQIGITGDNEIDTSSGNLTIDSAGGTVTIDDNLTVSGNLTVQGTTTTVNSTTIDVQNSLRFEGATSDAFETNLTVTDPTADRTITLPDATGYVPVFTSQPTAAITDGSAGQFLKTDGSGALSFATVSSDLVGDTTPQLGGNLDTNNNDIIFKDSDHLYLGTDSDLDFYHDGSNARLMNNTGFIYVSTPDSFVIEGTSGGTLARFLVGQGVELRYQNNVKLTTTTNGVAITGKITGLTDPTAAQDAATKAYVDANAGGGTSWQAVKTSAFTAVAGEGYFVNTTSAAITVTLPASPTLGDEVTLVVYAGTADTNNITVARNSENIQGSAADLTVSVERAAFTLVYTDGTQGWLLKDK